QSILYSTSYEVEVYDGCCSSFMDEPWAVTDFFFSSRRRHTRSKRDWSSDVCSSDLPRGTIAAVIVTHNRVDLLERSLDMVAKQTRRPDWVIVVDNGADPEVETLVHARLGGEPQSRRASAEITARRFAETQTVRAALAM